MLFLRFLSLGLLEGVLNRGIVLGFTFAVLILLRPVTNRLLRPKYRVTLWIAVWLLCGFGFSFYELAGKLKILPVTFRGWITSRESRQGYPAYFPEMDKAGDYTIELPGGLSVPFTVSELTLNVLAVLGAVGFIAVVWWCSREEKRLQKFSRRGSPMDQDWMKLHGVEEDGVEVRIMENLPASFVCRVGVGKHNICLQKELPRAQTELVLRHELAHIRRSHVWAKGLMIALACVHWWNPICWVAYRLGSRDIELACDEEVLSGLDENRRREYARMLVDLGSGKHLWGGLTCFGECDAEIRVRNAVKWKPELRWTGILIWPVLVLAFLFLFTSPNEARTDKNSEWDKYVQGVQLLQDMRMYFDDPTLKIDEIWERGENLLIRLENGEWHLFGFRWNDQMEQYYRSSHAPIVGEPGKYEFEKIERPVRGWVGDGRNWEEYVTGPMLEDDLRRLMDYPIEIVQIFECREGEILILAEDDYWPYWRCSFEPNTRNHGVWHPYHAERLERENFDISGLTYIKPWAWPSGN